MLVGGAVAHPFVAVVMLSSSVVGARSGVVAGSCYGAISPEPRSMSRAGT